MSNNIPPSNNDPNNQGPQPNPDYLNFLEQAKTKWDQLLGKQQKFDDVQQDINKTGKETSKIYNSIYTDAIKGLGNYSEKYAKLQQELSKVVEQIKEVKIQAEQWAGVSGRQAENMQKQYAGIIHSLESHEQKLKDNIDVISDMAKAAGHSTDAMIHLGEAISDSAYIQQRYGSTVKMTGQAILGLTGAMAGAVGGARSLGDYFSKGFEGFSQIKEANKDFLTLQYTLANVGKVDFSQMSNPAGALAGSAKAMRTESLKMMQDFGISFKEATASIANFGSVHPVTSDQAENWQKTSVGAARLAMEMKNTYGISEDLSRSLFKQDIQGQGKNMDGFANTLMSTAAAMKSLRVDTDAFNQTLSGLMQRTALYNIDNQQLITTLNNVGATQLRLNEAQKQALAQTMTQGISGMDFSSVIKEGALMRQGGLGKKYGLTGNAIEDYGRMQLAYQQNPTGLTADMVKSQALVRRQGLNFDLGTDAGKAKAMGVLALSQQANPEMDLTGLRQSILGANKGQTLQSLLDTLSKGKTQQVSGEELSKRQEAFKGMGIDQFSIAKMIGVEQIGEQVAPFLDPISKLLGQLGPGFLGAIGLTNTMVAVIMASVLKIAAFDFKDSLKALANLPELFPVLKNIPSMLGGLGSLPQSFGSLSTGIAGLGSILETIALPIVVAGSAIVALTNGIQGLSQFFGAKNSREQFSGIASMLGLGQRGGGAGAAMSGALGMGSIGLLIGTAVAGPVGAAVGAAIGGLVGALAGYFDLGAQFEKFGDYIDKTFGKQGTVLVRQIGTILVGGPIGAMMVAMENISTHLDDIKGIGDAISGAISGSVNGLKTFIQDFFKNSLGTINTVLSGIWKFMEPIIKWLQDTFVKNDKGAAQGTSTALQSLGVNKDLADSVGNLAGAVAGTTKNVVESTQKAIASVIPGNIPKNLAGLSKDDKMRAVVNASLKAAGGDIEQAKLTASQALLESGLLGKGSTLSNKYNNFFGIKGKGTAGSVTMPTLEDVGGHMVRTNAAFRAYNTADEGFAAHEEFLKKNSRYKGVLSANTFEDKARLIKQAGYATDRNYTGKLINTYNSNLAKYFNEVQTKQPIPTSSGKQLAAAHGGAVAPVTIIQNIKSTDPKAAAMEAAQRSKRVIEQHHEILTKDKGSNLNA